MARILAVDDEPGILLIMKAVLGTQKHEVVSIQDGNKALEILDSDEKLDCMISDVRMDPVNGIELLQHAKKVRPSMPVIMVTAFYSNDASETARGMGAFGYISKPFKADELISLVKRATEPAKN